MRSIVKKDRIQEPNSLLLALTLRHYLREVYPVDISGNCELRKKQKLMLLSKSRSI